MKGSFLTIRRRRMVLSLFVYTIISLNWTTTVFSCTRRNSLSLTFLSEVLSLIRPDFSLLSLYYWSVLPTYSEYKSSWTTQHQLVCSNFSETNNRASWLHTRASDLEIKLVISLKLFFQLEMLSYSIVSTFCRPK